MTPQEREAYRKGFIAGLIEFAWWADGEQMVGTCGKTLQEAIRAANERFERGESLSSLGDPVIVPQVAATFIRAFLESEYA